jgi:hypothetical protein
MALQKIPLQIRLDLDEVEALDQYIARFADFPPSRVTVVHRALREWLAEQLAIPPAGPALPAAIETAGREGVPVPADAAVAGVSPAVDAGLDAETREEIPPAPPDVPPAILPTGTEASPHVGIVSDADAHPPAPSSRKRPSPARPPLSRQGAPRKGGKARAT